mgnify:CR=1 FL=1
MRTLLIVDDEPRQVKSLSAIISRKWPQYRVLEATDAESAWGLLNEVPVDAVLTDIRMPDVDGLTLIERIAERSERIKTVLISGYGQFDYAQKAIQHRVVEYLVKPIGLGDIERVIGKLEDLFAKEHTLHRSESVYYEQLWNAWISGEITEGQKLELMKRVPAEGPGLVMCFELPKAAGMNGTTARQQGESGPYCSTEHPKKCDHVPTAANHPHDNTHSRSEANRQYETTNSSLADSQLNENTFQTTEVNALPDTDSSPTTAIPPQNKIDASGSAVRQLEQLREQWSALAKSLGFATTFLDAAKRRVVSVVWLERTLAARPSETISRVSRLFERLRDGGQEQAILGVSTLQPQLSATLPSAYESSLLSLKHHFYQEREAIVWGTDVRPFSATCGILHRLRELAEPLSTAIRADESAKAMALAGSLFQSQEAALPEPDTLKEQLALLVSRTAEHLHSLTPEEAEQWSHARIRASFDGCTSQQELRSRFKKQIHSLLELSARARQDKNGMLLLRCQSYLQEHYMEDLSLDAVAQRYHFNPSYFSTLFKQKIGVGFSEYILDLRIRQAQRLLEHSDDKISDVSDRVGFRNSTYFNKMFKRMTGLSPNAFRQMRGKGTGR